MNKIYHSKLLLTILSKITKINSNYCKKKILNHKNNWEKDFRNLSLQKKPRQSYLNKMICWNLKSPLWISSLNKFKLTAKSSKYKCRNLKNYPKHLNKKMKKIISNNRIRSNNWTKTYQTSNKNFKDPSTKLNNLKINN